MKIEMNDDILDFIYQITAGAVETFRMKETLTKYTERIITNKEEAEILDKYKKLGVNKITLKEDVSELIKNPFYKNIKLSDIKYKNISYKNRTLQARKCLSMSEPYFIKEGIKSYYDIGYFDVPVNIPTLREGNNLWMSPTIAEQRSMKRHIEKANGNVLTFGLGIGYYPYMCLLNDNNVESITIVEVNQDIIDLFKEFILPQFKTDKKIDIIHGNLYDYYKEEFLDKFDYIFVDIWDSNEDGLKHYRRIMQTGVKPNNVGFWIEKSIIEPIMVLMGLYFKAIASNTFTEVLTKMDGDNFLDLKRIHKYFRGIDKTVTSKEELIDYIYDINTIRNILTIK